MPATSPLASPESPNRCIRILCASFATHMLDHGAELPVIQVLLAHEEPRDTMIYLHLSTRKLKAAPSPLEMFDVATHSGPEPAAS